MVREKITECEEMLMVLLWESGEDLKLEEVTNRLKDRFGKVWKIQTTATILTRLENKGYLSRYKVGRYSHYHPEVSLDEYRTIKLTEVRNLLFCGNQRRMNKFIWNMQGGKHGAFNSKK